MSEYEDLAVDIRDRVLDHLQQIRVAFEYPESSDPKEAVRQMYIAQRNSLMERHRKALARHVPRLLNKFALGSEVDPSSIDPRLIPVNSSDDSGLLFRMASTLWSVPVSPGYGRRMRYLVEDLSNGKLIGIFALGDPVAGMGVRDKWIGWNVEQRRNRLSSVFDAYVCGAVPPYNRLLGGKLVTCLMSANEVVEEFDRRYRFKPNHWGQYKYPRLALITVTSALGRSSMYNRVKLPGIVELRRLNSPTSGWGHFQIPHDIFVDMRRLLSLANHRYSSGHHFGDGPNWRLRTIREALTKLGLSTEILQHGVSRDVFVMPLAANWESYLKLETDECELQRPDVNEIASAAKARWIMPRARRISKWAKWDEEDRIGLFEELTT